MTSQDSRNFVTVAVFTLPTDLMVAKSVLDDAEIENYTLNELTIQAYNFISNAVGGVQLKVAETDYEKVKALLVEGGFIPDEKPEPTFETRLATSKSLRKKLKIGILALAAVILTAILLIAINQPSDLDRLYDKTWCLDRIVYGNETYYPNTYDSSIFKVHFHFPCQEKIEFHGNGHVSLPGFDSPKISGFWSFENDSVYISRVDSFDFVFNGIYSLEMHDTWFVLRSDSTSLIAKQDRFYAF